MILYGPCSKGQVVTGFQTFPKGVRLPLQAVIGDQLLETQVDVVTTYPDRSIKTAYVAIRAPELPEGQHEILLIGGSSRYSERPLPEIEFLHNGIVVALASEITLGPLATRLRLTGQSGGVRIVVDLEDLADGQIHYDIVLANDLAFETPARRTGNFQLKASNGVENILAFDNYDIAPLTKRLLSHRPTVPWLAPDLKLLQKAGVVPVYGHVSPSLIQPLGWTKNMPMSGGRPDIGLIPEHYAMALAAPGPVTLRYLTTAAEATLQIPWHLWDGKLPVMVEGPRAGRWFDNRDKVWWPNGIPESEWVVDLAHMPSTAFVPYLLTGRRLYLDELMNQAAYAVAATAPIVRDPGLNLIYGGQLRGGAWAMREVMQCYWAIGPGEFKDYLGRVVEGTLTWLNGRLPYYKERYKSWAGWVPDTVYGDGKMMAPWQLDFFTLVMVMGKTWYGNRVMPFIHYTTPFYIRRFRQTVFWNPHNGVAYNLPTGVDSFSAADAELKRLGMDLKTGWPEADYAGLALATLNLLGSLKPQVAPAAEWLRHSGAFGLNALETWNFKWNIDVYKEGS